MPSKSKAKGNKWENDICKIFGKVFNLNFQRVPTSGAITGGKNSQLLQLLSDSQKLLLRGDIIVPDQLKKIVIECKSRKDFPYHQLLHNCKELDSWIEQIQNDLNEDDLIGLIIIKINNKIPMVCYSYKWISKGMKNNQTFINYTYMGEKYVIEIFNDQWLQDNKQFLLDWSKQKDDKNN